MSTAVAAIVSALTPAQIELLPSDADVARWREEGWYLSREIIPHALLDEVLAGCERYYRDERDACLPNGLRYHTAGWRRGGDPKLLRKNDFSSLQIRELMRLVRYPLIGAIAARLSGVDVIRLWHDQLLYKPAGDTQGPVVGWHTDRSYWKSCTSDEMLTAWVPFDDVSADMGPLCVVPRNRKVREDALGAGFFAKDMAAQEAAMADGKPVPAIPLIMRRGQVSFHHCRTVHGSGPNTSPRPRRSMAIHLQPGDNRYRAVPRADGSAINHDLDVIVRKVDGYPDYSDPAACPVLWKGPVPQPRG